MPADRPQEGTGARRQGRHGQPPADDSRKAQNRALDREDERGALDEVFDPGRQPGAHGRQGPHRPVKPGTRLSMEQARKDRS